MKQPIHLEKLTVELTERSTWLFSHLRFHFVASSHTFVAFRRAASGPFRKEKVAGKKEQTHRKEGLGGGTRWDSSGWKISRIDTVRARQEGRNVEHEANARARVPRMEGERECCSNARRRSTRWPRARLRSRRAVRHEPDLRLGKESEKPGCMRWFLRSIVRHFVVVEWTDQGCAFLESSWSTNGTDGRWWIAMVVCRYHPVGGALRCRLVAVAGCGGAQRCLGRERSTPCLRTRRRGGLRGAPLALLQLRGVVRVAGGRRVDHGARLFQERGPYVGRKVAWCGGGHTELPHSRIGPALLGVPVLPKRRGRPPLLACDR
eukprot:scaffold1708_cov322-Pavlova_lutheri.AAC.4